MIDILERLANSSCNESSHELQCRCFDAAEEVSRNRAAIAELVAALRDAVNMVEYLHRKFQETGSGNGFVAQWEYMITKHQQPTTTKEDK